MKAPNKHIGVVSCSDCPFARAQLVEGGVTVSCAASALLEGTYRPLKGRRRLEECPLEAAPAMVHIQGHRLTADQVEVEGWQGLIPKVSQAIHHNWDFAQSRVTTARALLGLGVILLHNKANTLKGILGEVSFAYDELITKPAAARKKRWAALKKKVDEDPAVARQVWDRLARLVEVHPPGSQLAIEWGCQCPPNTEQHQPTCVHGGDAEPTA